MAPRPRASSCSSCEGPGWNGSSKCLVAGAEGRAPYMFFESNIRSRPSTRGRTRSPRMRTLNLIEERQPEEVSVLGGRVAPELLQARIPPAARAVEGIADRILLVVALVVVLGLPEGPGLQDLGDDRTLQDAGRLEGSLRGLGRLPLRVVGDEDRGAVLRAVVAELAVRVRRVDVVPEDVQELLVRDLLWVVHHLDRLAVPRAARGDFVVRGIRLLAARVSHGRRDDAREVVVRLLHAPETAAREGGFHESSRHGRRRDDRLVRPREDGEEDEGEERNEKSNAAAYQKHLQRLSYETTAPHG